MITTDGTKIITNVPKKVVNMKLKIYEWKIDAEHLGACAGTFLSYLRGPVAVVNSETGEKWVSSIPSWRT